MKLERNISVDGIEFVATQNTVPVSPPDSTRPKSYYANINSLERKELFPLCAAISGCWQNSDFVDEIIARGSSNCQSVAGFYFFDSNEYEEEPPPEIRLDLEPGERGVTTHYLMDNVEVSPTFFVKLVLAFGEFCIETDVGSKHTESDLQRIRAEFNI